MMSQYDVYHDREIVGKVYIEKVGLYYSVKCQCQLQKDCLYKLFWENSGVVHNIGVCIPNGETMEVYAKIPISHIGKGSDRFYIASGINSGRTDFPVKPDLPFPQVDMLRRGRFCKDECAKIVFRGESVNYLQKNR